MCEARERERKVGLVSCLFYVIVINCLKHSREFEISRGRDFSFYLGLEGFQVKYCVSFIYILQVQVFNFAKDLKNAINAITSLYNNSTSLPPVVSISNNKNNPNNVTSQFINCKPLARLTQTLVKLKCSTSSVEISSFIETISK